MPTLSRAARCSALAIQPRVMNYSDPSTTVVYEEEPAEQEKLLAIAGYTRSLRSGECRVPNHSGFSEFHVVSRTGYPYFAESFPFLHSRSAAGGPPRILIVGGPGEGPKRSMLIGVFAPGSAACTSQRAVDWQFHAVRWPEAPSAAPALCRAARSWKFIAFHNCIQRRWGAWNARWPTGERQLRVVVRSSRPREISSSGLSAFVGFFF